MRAVWFRERRPTHQSRSTDLLKAIFWFAAHNRFAMSSSICEASPRRNLHCFSVHSVPKVDEQEWERAAIECAAAGSFVEFGESSTRAVRLTPLRMTNTVGLRRNAV